MASFAAGRSTGGRFPSGSLEHAETDHRSHLQGLHEVEEPGDAERGRGLSARSFSPSTPAGGGFPPSRDDPVGGFGGLRPP